MRGRLRALGVEGVAARTFHAAALAQLNFFWPTLAGDTAPSIVDNKVRRLAHAADGIGISPDVATLRWTSASEIEWRKVSMLSIEDYAPRASERDRPAGQRRPCRGTAARVREAQGRASSARFRGRPSSRVPACSRPSRRCRKLSASNTGTSGRTSSRMSRPCRTGCSNWLGDRRDLCVVGDASQTIYLVRGRRRTVPARVRQTVRGRSGGPPRDQLPIGCRDPRRRQRADARAARRLHLTAADFGRGHGSADRTRRTPVAPLPTVTAYDDDRAEARAVAARIASPDQRGHRPRATSRCCTERTRQSAELIAALSDVGIAPSVLGGRASSTCLRCGRRSWRCGGVGGAHRERLRRHRARHAPLSASRRIRRAGAAEALRDAWESPAACCDWRRRRPRAPRSGRSPTSSPLARRPTTSRRCARSPWRPLHAAKGLEWDHVHLVGIAEGPAVDLIRDDLRAGRRGTAPGVRRHHAGWANAVADLVARRTGAVSRPGSCERSAAALCVPRAVRPHAPVERTGAQAHRARSGTSRGLRARPVAEQPARHDPASHMHGRRRARLPGRSAARPRRATRGSRSRRWAATHARPG